VAARAVPGVLHTVADETGLHELGQKHSIKIGNLRQLAGLDQSPGGVRRKTCDKDWMLLQDVLWLRSDMTGVVVPVVGALQRFVNEVALLRDDMPIKAADTLGKLFRGTLKSNNKPVDFITTFKWRALRPSADEARSYLTLAPVIDADDAPVGAAGDASGGAAGDAPASLEPECAPPHQVSSSAPQPLPASRVSPSCQSLQLCRSMGSVGTRPLEVDASSLLTRTWHLAISRHNFSNVTVCG
jgi:hypothetical protein